VQLIRTEIPDVLEVVLGVHRDERGWLAETFNRAAFAEAGLPVDFAQDNSARSRRGALRGLHFQRRPGQAKLVRAVRGAAFDVAVDVRAGSLTFGRFVARRLEEGDGRLLFLPAGFAHGYQALGDDVEVAYKLTSPYEPSEEAGLAWDDPDLAIPWPLAEPVLSARDRGWPKLASLPPWRAE
jgi:dTDP-4-dehydrorhamnose 3,5-epimerase